MSRYDQACLDSFEKCESENAVPLEIYCRLPPDENGFNYLTRQRWVTFAEFYRSMHKALNLSVCSACKFEAPWHRDNWEKKCPKCGGEFASLIDEYDSGYKDTHSQIGEKDDWLHNIVCYSHVGGNEGYYAECGALLMKQEPMSTRYVRLYWLKSFTSMEHVHEIVKRMMIAAGTWPGWCLKNKKGDDN
jgi:hypothetical protein